MVRHIIEQYTGKQFRTIKQLASQIAGRKPGRGHYNFRVPRELQDRRQKNPYKDIAASDIPTLTTWLEEDGHHGDHAKRTGGSLSNAFRHIIGTMHHTVRRDVHEHLQKHHADLHAKLKVKHKGGSLGSLLSDGWNAITGAADKLGSTISTGLKRGYDVLDNTAKAVGVQADVLSDKFLHAVGLRSQKKYQDAEVTDQMRFHARLNKSVYGSVDDREDVGDFKYIRDESTDDFGVYSDGKKAYFTFRGTRPKEALTGQNNDLLEDGKIALGTTSTMTGIDDARSRIRKLISKYGEHNVSLSS